jgi:hypothetical protein
VSLGKVEQGVKLAALVQLYGNHHAIGHPFAPNILFVNGEDVSLDLRGVCPIEQSLCVLPPVEQLLERDLNLRRRFGRRVPATLDEQVAVQSCVPRTLRWRP